MIMDTIKDTTMLVCCHKSDYFRCGDGFFPIQVGKAISKCDLGITGDNSEENISSKNPNYCELTAHYWLWRNKKYGKFVGLSHYRRYFDFNLNLPFWKSYKSISVSQANKTPPTLPKNISEILQKYDIVLAKPNLYPYSLKHDYCYCHIIEDYEILKAVVKNLTPEYFDSFIKIMEHNNKLSHYNMFLTNNKIFEDYSEWLFKILFEVEKKCKISEYPSQARIFGYMSERLLNVYVHKHNLRVKYVPIVKIEDKQIKQGHLFLRNLKTRIIANINSI